MRDENFEIGGIASCRTVVEQVDEVRLGVTALPASTGGDADLSAAQPRAGARRSPIDSSECKASSCQCRKSCQGRSA